jgi:hypothetical protein
MFAGGGLGFVQGGLNFTHAHGFVLKHFHDFHPGRIRQGFHHFDKLFHGRFLFI